MLNDMLFYPALVCHSIILNARSLATHAPEYSIYMIYIQYASSYYIQGIVIKVFTFFKLRNHSTLKIN